MRRRVRPIESQFTRRVFAATISVLACKEFVQRLTRKSATAHRIGGDQIRGLRKPLASTLAAVKARRSPRAEQRDEVGPSIDRIASAAST
jgi:hypothetical protein